MVTRTRTAEEQYRRSLARFSSRISDLETKRLQTLYRLPALYNQLPPEAVLQGLELLGVYSASRPEGVAELPNWLGMRELQKAIRKDLKKIKDVRLNEGFCLPLYEELYSAVNLRTSFAKVLEYARILAAHVELLHAVTTTHTGTNSVPGAPHYESVGGPDTLKDVLQLLDRVQEGLKIASGELRLGTHDTNEKAEEHENRMGTVKHRAFTLFDGGSGRQDSPCLPRKATIAGHEHSEWAAAAASRDSPTVPRRPMTEEPPPPSSIRPSQSFPPLHEQPHSPSHSLVKTTGENRQLPLPHKTTPPHKPIPLIPGSPRRTINNPAVPPKPTPNTNPPLPPKSTNHQHPELPHKSKNPPVVPPKVSMNNSQQLPFKTTATTSNTLQTVNKALPVSPKPTKTTQAMYNFSPSTGSAPPIKSHHTKEFSKQNPQSVHRPAAGGQRTSASQRTPPVPTKKANLPTASHGSKQSSVVQRFMKQLNDQSRPAGHRAYTGAHPSAARATNLSTDSDEDDLEEYDEAQDWVPETYYRQ